MMASNDQKCQLALKKKQVRKKKSEADVSHNKSVSFAWLNRMTRAYEQKWHLSAQGNTATTWGVHGRTYALQASQSHYGRVGAHAEQQHVEDQRPPRLTRLGLLLLPLLLQFDSQEVLLFRLLFEFVLYRPWRPHTGLVMSQESHARVLFSSLLGNNKQQTTDF